jgi:biopolymer transport protein ExbB/TolQ
VKAKRNFLIAGMIIGSLLMVASVVGLIGTVFGITHAFNALGPSGIGDPGKVSADVGATLGSTVAGIVLFPIGVVVFTVSLILLLRQRASSPPALPRPPVQ